MKISKSQIESLVTSERATEWSNTPERWIYCTQLLDTLYPDADVDDISDSFEDWAVEILEDALDQQYLADIHKNEVEPLRQAHEANEELGNDWIVGAAHGKFYVLDNQSLRQDGIIAHAVHSTHESCNEAKEVCMSLQS